MAGCLWLMSALMNVVDCLEKALLWPECLWLMSALMNVGKSSYNSSITGFDTLYRPNQQVSDGLATFNSGRSSTCCTDLRDGAILESSERTSTELPTHA